MIGNFEPENLRGAQKQSCLGAWRVVRKSFLKIAADQVTQRAEPPQHRGGEPAREGAVAIGEGGQTRMCVLARQKIVERNAPPQNAVEDVGGNSSSGEAGNFRLRGSARARHT